MANSDSLTAPLAKRINRSPDGRWVKGHGEPGPGNPNSQATTLWRAELAKTITVEDVGEVLAQLVKAARTGERWAVTELLDRTLGRPTIHAVIEGDSDQPKYKILIGVDEDRL